MRAVIAAVQQKVRLRKDIYWVKLKQAQPKQLDSSETRLRSAEIIIDS